MHLPVRCPIVLLTLAAAVVHSGALAAPARADLEAVRAQVALALGLGVKDGLLCRQLEPNMLAANDVTERLPQKSVRQRINLENKQRTWNMKSRSSTCMQKSRMYRQRSAKSLP